MVLGAALVSWDELGLSWDGAGSSLSELGSSWKLP